MILAVDTTTRYLSSAIADSKGKVILEVNQYEPFMHAERINIITDFLIKAVGKQPSDIQYLVIPEGPGLFTSLRVSASFAKAVAVVHPHIKVVAISSFRALWYPFRGYKVATLLDAKKKEVFASAFDEEGNEVLSPTIMKPRDLYERLGDRFLYVGEGAEIYRDIFKNVPPANPVFPHARHMIALALEKIEKSQFVDIDTFEPHYLRQPDAVVKKRGSVGGNSKPAS